MQLPEEPQSRRSGFFTKVFGAAAQGAVAACVAALLSAFTEPIVNRLLTLRCTVKEAIDLVKVRDCLTFFLTTWPTNMLKFPIYEVLHQILSYSSMWGSLRGVINGALFCTIMLPVTNYRFRKSMGLSIEPQLLFQAYPPTVLRDVAYGWARGLVYGILARNFMSESTGFILRAIFFGFTVSLACIISSPFHEWRGYWLQQPTKKLPFHQFFKPDRYVRSTGVSAAIMGISLMVGTLLVPVAEGLFEFVFSNRLVTLLTIGGAVALAKNYSKP